MIIYPSLINEIVIDNWYKAAMPGLISGRPPGLAGIMGNNPAMPINQPGQINQPGMMPNVPGIPGRPPGLAGIDPNIINQQQNAGGISMMEPETASNIPGGESPTGQPMGPSTIKKEADLNQYPWYQALKNVGQEGWDYFTQPLRTGAKYIAPPVIGGVGGTLAGGLVGRPGMGGLIGAGAGLGSLANQVPAFDSPYASLIGAGVGGLTGTGIGKLLNIDEKQRKTVYPPPQPNQPNSYNENPNIPEDRPPPALGYFEEKIDPVTGEIIKTNKGLGAWGYDPAYWKRRPMEHWDDEPFTLKSEKKSSIKRADPLEDRYVEFLSVFPRFQSGLIDWSKIPQETIATRLSQFPDVAPIFKQQMETHTGAFTPASGYTALGGTGKHILGSKGYNAAAKVGPTGPATARMGNNIPLPVPSNVSNVFNEENPLSLNKAKEIIPPITGLSGLNENLYKTPNPMSGTPEDKRFNSTNPHNPTASEFGLDKFHHLSPLHQGLAGAGAGLALGGLGNLAYNTFKSPDEPEDEARRGTLSKIMRHPLTGLGALAGGTALGAYGLGGGDISKPFTSNFWKHSTDTTGSMSTMAPNPMPSPAPMTGMMSSMGGVAGGMGMIGSALGNSTMGGMSGVMNSLGTGSMSGSMNTVGPASTTMPMNKMGEVTKISAFCGGFLKFCYQNNMNKEALILAIDRSRSDPDIAKEWDVVFEKVAVGIGMMGPSNNPTGGIKLTPFQPPKSPFQVNMNKPQPMFTGISGGAGVPGNPIPNQGGTDHQSTMKTTAGDDIMPRPGEAPQGGTTPPLSDLKSDNLFDRFHNKWQGMSTGQRTSTVGGLALGGYGLATNQPLLGLGGAAMAGMGWTGKHPFESGFYEGKNWMPQSTNQAPEGSINPQALNVANMLGVGSNPMAGGAAAASAVNQPGMPTPKLPSPASTPQLNPQMALEQAKTQIPQLRTMLNTPGQGTAALGQISKLIKGMDPQARLMLGKELRPEDWTSLRAAAQEAATLASQASSGSWMGGLNSAMNVFGAGHSPEELQEAINAPAMIDAFQKQVQSVNSIL